MRQPYPPPDQDFVAQDEQPRSKLLTLFADSWPIILGLSLITLCVLGGGIFLLTHPDVATVLRDIAIIFLMMFMLLMVVVMILLLAVLVFLVFKISDLVDVLKQGSLSTFNNADHILRRVYSHVVVTGDEVVKPIIRLSSYGAGIRAIIQTLFKRD